MTSTSVEEKIYSRQVFKDSLTKQTIGKENDPTRYFTSMDLFELFKIGDFTKSKVCDQFNEMHGTLEDKMLKNLEYSDELTEEQQLVLSHKEKIISQIQEVYNISSHDLVFSKGDETLNTSGLDFAYLNDEVKTAKDMLLKENLLANGKGNNRVNLETEILSAKQKLLTQKYGVQFLPLGNNFSQYRDVRERFGFNKPKPKSPVKIVNLDDDDEIQFIDTTNNRLIPSLLHKQQSTPKVSVPSNELDSSSLSIHSNPSVTKSSSSLKSFMTNDTVSSSSSLRSISTNDKTTSISSNLNNSNLKINNANNNLSKIISIAPSPVKLNTIINQNDPDLVELSFDSKTNSSLMSVDEEYQENNLNDLLTSFESSMRIDSSDLRKNKNDSSVIVLD